MIRVGLPGATLLRARLRLQFALSRISRRAERAWGLTCAAPRSLASAVRAQAHAAADRRLLRRAARVDPAQLRAFGERCDELIGLLCWAAQTRDPLAAEQYAALRVWLLRHYRSVRPAVLMAASMRGDSVSVSACRRIGARDPVEALFLPHSLDAVINDPDSLLLIACARQAADAALSQGEPAA
ncbi:MAG TPA: hypothetical protein VLH79_04965 [Chthonomonadales bacterium]|nr:hypothetical protein [Chthonomonadales bacterium]